MHYQLAVIQQRNSLSKGLKLWRVTLGNIRALRTPQRAESGFKKKPKKK